MLTPAWALTDPAPALGVTHILPPLHWEVAPDKSWAEVVP